MDLDTRLAHYRIIGRLGAGGMGEVYRAEDTRLRREVAIKVLPAEVASDSERLARLEREAQLLAALDHPNIAAVYGLEEAVPQPDGQGPVRFLVMQLAEGETLAEHLTPGPLAAAEARAVTQQLVAGLEAAHERGIVHRDLKPANVMMADDGGVKILDFGLAKTMGTDLDAGGSVDLTASPTVLGSTRIGTIMGTASYMAPEQARGRTIDKRADIWALGVVLFEMLSGGKAFDGETATDIIAAVVKDELDWSRLPASAPADLVALARRCLVKEPRDRLRDLGDARIALRDGTLAGQAAAPSGAPARPALLAGLAAAAAALGWLASAALQPAEPLAPMRQAHLKLAHAITVGVASIALSPDGETLVYAASDRPGGTEMLWAHQLRDAGVRKLPGTEDPFAPFFSPDSRSVAFWSDRQLRKVAVDGGSAPVTLVEVPGGLFGVWATDGNIYLGTRQGGLWRLPEEGGDVDLLVRGDGDRFYAWPTMVPGRDAVLVTSFPNAAQTDLRNARLEQIDLRSGEATVLAEKMARTYLLPSGDLIAFGDGGTMNLLAYDPRAPRVDGPQVPVRAGIEMVFGAWPMAALSETGTLVYLGGSAGSEDVSLYWLSGSLEIEPVFTPPVGRFDIDSQISPDGRFVALEYTGDTPGVSIWLLDLERGAFSPLAEHRQSAFATWSPDGRWVAYSAVPDGEPPGLFRVPVDRSGPAERLTRSPDSNRQSPTSWHPDGSLIAFHHGGDIWLLPVAGDRSPRPFLQTEGVIERRARFSPDGRWVAYESDRSGRFEVYVRPFPGPGGAVQISNAAAIVPSWSPDGGRILYRDPSHGLWEAPVRFDRGELVAGRPERVVAGDRIDGVEGIFVPIGMGSDGRRLGFVQPLPRPPQELEVVFNWFREAERLLAARR